MIHIQNAVAPLGEFLQLTIDDLHILPNTNWAIIGSNGSGKSALAGLLSGTIDVEQGQLQLPTPKNVSVVSFEEQQQLIERENERDDSDLTNKVWLGTPVIELLREVSQDQATIEHWVKAFAIEHLLEKGFRKLSTGESRKVILIRALLQPDNLLILDEPFDGLDANSQHALKEVLQQQQQAGRQIIFILNRLDEVPPWVDHLGFLHNLNLLAKGNKQSVLDNESVKAFLTFNNATLALPKRDSNSPQLSSQIQTLAKLVNNKVAYSERIIFQNVNWQINRGEHWAVLGPNGCGKSTLLNLISGDHPQCYSNDLTVFGIKRGSGESIWDIKRHIGIISAAMQWNYKDSTSVLNTVISGIFDSIGLYKKVADHQKNLALQWLKQVKLEHKATHTLKQLSYGEQRLVLICRAMIKQPALLILDEPCQGLDDANRQLVLGFIELLAQQQDTTLLYVTHNSNDLLPCFDKRLVCTSFNEVSGSQWQIHS